MLVCFTIAMCVSRLTWQMTTKGVKVCAEQSRFTHLQVCSDFCQTGIKLKSERIKLLNYITMQYNTMQFTFLKIQLAGN